MKIKRIIRQLFTLTVASLIVGCGGSSDSKPMNIVGETATLPPLASQKVLSMLTADHIGDISMTDTSGKTVYALPSALFKEFGAGLIASPLAPAVKLNATQVSNAPVGFGFFDLIVLGDIIYGIVEDVTGKKEQETQFSDLGKQLDKTNANIDNVGKQLGSLINSTWGQLNLTAAMNLVFEANSRIDSKYNAADNSGFRYFVHQRSLIAICENIVATIGSSTTCTPEQQIAYDHRDLLKIDAATFAVNLKNKGTVNDDVALIHSVIVPSGNAHFFKALVTEILIENDPLTGTAKDKAMNAYLLLEGMFSQFLSHQYQGASMIVNAKNYDDKTTGTAIGFSANSYMTGTFEGYLREECKEFLAQVNWLVVNLNDYRNKDIYAADMMFVKQGLATDPVFSDVVARSRFFCAQVLQPYNENRQKGTNGTFPPDTAITENVVGNGFGLKGTIVVPADYTKKEPITLNFYDTNNNLAATTSTTPIVHSGRYPYTKWVPYAGTGYNYNIENLAAEASYDWLVYDIDLSASNLVAGTYIVRFAEKGKDPNGNTGPWVHDDTLLGTVNLQYFDPKNPAVGNNKANTASAQLFGSFSLSWPWNFQRFTTSPVNFVTNLQNVWSVPNPSKNFAISPDSKYKGLVNQITYSRQHFKSKSDELRIFMPFTISAPTANVAVVYKSTKNQVQGNFDASYPQGKYMKNYGVGYFYNIDSTKISTNKATDTLITIDSGKSEVRDPYIWSANSKYIKSTMNNEEIYNLNVGVELSSTYISGWDIDVDSSIDADLNWYMQLLFTDKKDVSKIQ